MRFLRYAVVFVAAFVAGMIGALPVYVMGLVVPMDVIWPLTLGTAALVAAVAASWAANIASTDGSRSRLMAVLGVCEVAAVAIAAFRPVLFVVPALDALFLGIPPIQSLVLAVCLISLSASAATWRLRSPGGRLGWDGAAALVLSACGSIFLLLVNPVVPVVPPAEYVLVNYEIVVWTSLAAAVLGLLATACFYSRGVSGRELARDAAVTLCVLAAILPVVSGTIHVSCSTLVRCGA